jgi:hypothetical protein
VIVPASFADGTGRCFTFNPSRVSCATASVTFPSTNDGTVTRGSPVETQIRIAEPFGMRWPKVGSCR